MAKTRREREKQAAKRLRNEYRRIASKARRGVPGSEAKRDALDAQLKLLGVRSNV